MSTQLEKFISDSELILDKQQSDLEEAKKDILSFLTENVINKIILRSLIIQSRVKHKKSLREKIIRKNYFSSYETADTFVSNLTDIIGIRIVCLLEKEEDLLFKELDKLFSENSNEYSMIPGTTNTEKYLKINKKEQPKPQKNGHKIYKLDCQWVHKEIVINVELQLKSLVHMFWGEIEHMLFYKNYSYAVGADFFRSYMDSIKKMLNTVDSQLDIIKNQSFLNSSNKQNEEVRQMVTKLVYNHYQPSISKIYRCDLDLREIYELIVYMEFQGIVEDDKVLAKVKDIISALHSNSQEIDINTLEFGNYNFHISSLSKELNTLANKLNNLAKSEDVFWKVLFGIQKLMLNETDFSIVIEITTRKFMNFFRGLSDGFDEGLNEITGMIMNSINLGIVKSFISYGKLDFFSPGVHQKRIFDTLTNFILNNKDEFSDLQEDLTQLEKENLKDLVTLLVEIEVNSIIHNRITSQELISLNTLLDCNEIAWEPEIDRVKMAEIIDTGLPIERNLFKLLFNKSEVII